MNKQDFTLIPFAPDSAAAGMNIRGSVRRHRRLLAIRYLLSGPLHEIVIPTLSDRPTRQENLWRETCFEFFFGLQNSDQYWEVNLSPSGHWNVYRFSSYRQGMLEEAAFAEMAVKTQTQPDGMQLQAELDLGRIGLSDKSLLIGVSAVTLSAGGLTTYWALVHPGRQPDFHRPDSFIIRMEPAG